MLPLNRRKGNRTRSKRLPKLFGIFYRNLTQNRNHIDEKISGLFSTFPHEALEFKTFAY